MYKKVILSISIICIGIFFQIPFYAQTYLKDEESNIQDETICSNYEYTLYNEGNQDYKTIGIYSVDNYLLEEYETNAESITITIPNNIDAIKIVISDLEKVTTDYENAEILNFKVEDCSYDDIKEDYAVTQLNSSFELNQGNLSFTLNEDKKNYELYYRTEEKLKGEQVKQDTKIEIPKTPYIVQFNEKYTTDDGYVSNYYEMMIYDQENYIIRPINDFDISQIKAPPISNIYFYFLAILIILFLFFRYKEKKFRKKRKRLKEKRRRDPKKGKNNDRNR